MKLTISDKELEAELRGMHIDNWETRYSGNGRKSLYLRLKPDVRTLKVNLKKGK